MVGLHASLLVSLAALTALALGGIALRTGMRTLANHTLNPAGGLDNLAVTLMGIGIALIGWGIAGPAIWFLR